MHHRGPVRATEKERATLKLMLLPIVDPPSHQGDRGKRTQFCSPDLTQPLKGLLGLPYLKTKFLAYYQATY